MGKQWKQWLFIPLGSKITADGDCSHEIKGHLLLRRKAMTNLDSVLKSRDITFLTKVHIVKAMMFLAVMYGCKSCTMKKVEHWRIDAFRLWFWRTLSRVFSSTTVWKHEFFGAQPLWSNDTYMTTGKTIALTKWIFVIKVMSLLFNTLSRFVIAFLSRSKHL